MSRNYKFQNPKGLYFVTFTVVEWLDWQHESHPIEIWSNHIVSRKINYIHNNPTKQGFVSKSEHYIHSSASDYAGKKGPLDGVVIFNMMT